MSFSDYFLIGFFNDERVIFSVTLLVKIFEHLSFPLLFKGTHDITRALDLAVFTGALELTLSDLNFLGIVLLFQIFNVLECDQSAYDSYDSH